MSTDKRSYLVVLMPIDNSDHFALSVNRQDADAPAIGKPLAAQFGFTPREVAVPLPMLEGNTIEEIAELLGIAQTTARTHLDNILTKTRTRRQADPVQKVLSSMPALRLA
jgi:DNA-binding NarL/FixJ family response regulator